MQRFNTLLLLSTLLFVACGKDTDTTEHERENNPSSIEEKIVNKLNRMTTDTDFTLLLKSKNNKIFSHSVGEATPSTYYASASTSKWVTTTIILSLVKEGILSLEDHPQQYISTWNSSGNLSTITLKDLLSFTSGLNIEPFCLNLEKYNFEQCVQNIASKNSHAKPAGEEFHYGPNHLQVAGLMAIKATGKTSWQELFKDFQNNTKLFSSAKYDLPSSNNPRLAGGMHWNANEYLAFLEALYKENILTPQLIKLMINDQSKQAVMENSPALDGIKEDWHYGFGTWIECHKVTNNCSETTRVSSPGAFGAYPFIDYEHQYYGILAREGKYGTFTKGYKLFETVSSDLETWAKEN